jgi:hypothetical protein
MFEHMQRRCGRPATLLLLLGALFLGSAAGSAGDGEAEIPGSNVLILTDKSLDAKVGKASYLLLEFYAPWCGRCQEVAPAFEEAATELKRYFHPRPRESRASCGRSFQGLFGRRHRIKAPHLPRLKGTP